MRSESLVKWEVFVVPVDSKVSITWEMNFRDLYNDFDVQFCMRMNEQQAGPATEYSI